MIYFTFRTGAVALVCSAMVAFVAPHSFAQSTSKDSRDQQVTLQLVSREYSRVVLIPSQIAPKANGVFKTQREYNKTRETTSKAKTTMACQEKQLIWPHSVKPTMLSEEIGSSIEAARIIMRGAKLIPNGILLRMMKDEKALSRAEKNTREGHGMLERGQKIVMTPRL